MNGVEFIRCRIQFCVEAAHLMSFVLITSPLPLTPIGLGNGRKVRERDREEADGKVVWEQKGKEERKYGDG